MADIAVVDDEILMRDLIKTSLGRLDHNIELFACGDDFIKEYTINKYDIVITDLKMPGISGLDLAKEVLAVEPNLNVILMTAYGTIDSAVSAMKMGVQDFIEKPFRVERLEHTVAKVLELSNLKVENKSLKKDLANKYRFVGTSETVKQLITMVKDVATAKSTVLVTGESGTGKELIAHAIHLSSQRCNAPFVKINCAAIPEHLIESELFGHEKGAYTGAVKSRMGKFELAHGGTILLDEIGEMPLQAQSKLLRVLQERELTKIGGNEVTPIDIRVICTTNRDLQKEVKEGNFREDLFYRLNVIPLKIPPLRERKNDLLLLCDLFIKKYNEENGFQVTGISKDALEYLMKHDWPGNVRELENVIQRAVVFTKFKEIEIDVLNLFEQKSVDQGLELYSGMTVAQGEKQLILKTLEESKNNRTKAAELLGISVRTLRNKLNEYQMREKAI